jgi:filamentous hemagglutinin
VLTPHNAHLAVIERAKLASYCLDPRHEDGRHKARVFKAALGFDRANADDLISAIRTGIITKEATYVGETAHGFLWRVDMPIAGPGGAATVRTGWIYEKGKDVPRLTTAYVLGGR